MSRIAVHSIRIATTDEAGKASPGVISKVIEYHGIVTVTTADDGPVLAAGATGFLLKGVEGMTACRVDGTAADADGTPDQVLVLEGETEYLPAAEGKVLGIIEVA